MKYDKKKNDIFEMIIKERYYQDITHPQFPDNQFERVSLILEELGEASQALNDRDIDEFQSELIQTAALIFRVLETFDVIKSRKYF